MDEKHEMTTLLWKNGGKEKDTKTTLRLLHIQMQQMQGSLHVRLVSTMFL